MVSHFKGPSFLLCIGTYMHSLTDSLSLSLSHSESSEKISLLSVHNCKLGEFPAIYLPGLPVVATVESNVLSNRSRGPQYVTPSA